MNKLTDFPAGTRLWSPKYLTHGTVDHPAKTLVHVLMDITGKVRTFKPDELEFPVESRVQREMRTHLRLQSTTIRPPRPEPAPLNARQRRARRNGAERYRTSIITTP
jgi:hypothetical protein